MHPIAILINTQSGFLLFGQGYNFAYLDPGSGSFILQILLATLVGFLFLLKGYWSKIKLFFRAKLRRGPNSDQSKSDPIHPHEPLP